MRRKSSRSTIFRSLTDRFYELSQRIEHAMQKIQSNIEFYEEGQGEKYLRQVDLLATDMDSLTKSVNRLAEKMSMEQRAFDYYLSHPEEHGAAYRGITPNVRKNSRRRTSRRR